MREPTTLEREGTTHPDPGTTTRTGGVGLRTAGAPSPTRSPAAVPPPEPNTNHGATTALGLDRLSDPDWLIWRYAIVGGFFGFIGVTTAISVLYLLVGQDSGASVGLGLFLGTWGGLGFGGMAGAAIAATRLHTAEG